MDIKNVDGEEGKEGDVTEGSVPGIDAPVVDGLKAEAIQAPKDGSYRDGGDADAAGDVGQIIDSARLNLVIERLVAEKARVEEVRADSEIKENVVFSKRDISKLIVEFAAANKLDLDRLEVSKSVVNEKGDLLQFEVEFHNPDGGYRLFAYTIKGRNGGNYNVAATGIDQSFWDADDMPDYGYSGCTFAEYLDGEWRIVG